MTENRSIRMTSTPQTMHSLQRKTTFNLKECYIRLERMDCRPYASPFTPKRIVKKKTNERNKRTIIIDQDNEADDKKRGSKSESINESSNSVEQVVESEVNETVESSEDVVENNAIFETISEKKSQLVEDTNENNCDSMSEIKSLEDVIWKKSSQSTGVDIAIISENKAKQSYAFGMLRLGPEATKNSSNTGDYVTHLTVIYGALLISVEGNCNRVIRTGDYFKLNSNTNYSLSNLRKEISYLYFTVLED